MYLIGKMFYSSRNPGAVRIDGVYAIVSTIDEARKCYEENRVRALEMHGNSFCGVYKIHEGDEDYYFDMQAEHDNARDIYGYSPVTDVTYIDNTLKRIEL